MTTRLIFLRTLAAAAVITIAPVGVDAYETWPAKNREVVVDVDAYNAFARSQYQHTGDVFTLVDENTLGRFQDLGIAIDAEFGLLDRIALFVDTRAATVRVASDYATANASGLADFRLGGKWLVTDKAFSITVAPAVKFPTGYTADPGPFMPSLGNGVNEYEARVWLGKRFVDAPFFFEIGSGYRFRGTRVPRGGGPRTIYSDEIPYDLEIGFDVGDAIALRLLVDGVVGLGKPDVVDQISLQPLTQDYTRVGGAIGYSFNDNVGVFASYRATVAGINALNLQQLALSLHLQYGVGSE